jgi:hypothetical protein
MYRAKRKKPTTITFSRHDDSTSQTGTSRSTTGVLREKTTIRQDGVVRQNRSIVSLAVEARAAQEYSESPPQEPIYEPYTIGDHGDDPYNEEEDDGGRDLRASVRSHFYSSSGGNSLFSMVGRSAAPMGPGPPRDLSR